MVMWCGCTDNSGDTVDAGGEDSQHSASAVGAIPEHNPCEYQITVSLLYFCCPSLQFGFNRGMGWERNGV